MSLLKNVKVAFRKEQETQMMRENVLKNLEALNSIIHNALLEQLKTEEHFDGFYEENITTYIVIRIRYEARNKVLTTNLEILKKSIDENESDNELLFSCMLIPTNSNCEITDTKAWSIQNLKDIHSYLIKQEFEICKG